MSDRQSWGVDLLAGRSAADGSAAAYLLYRQKSFVWILLPPQDNFFLLLHIGLILHYISSVFTNVSLMKLYSLFRHTYTFFKLSITILLLST